MINMLDLYVVPNGEAPVQIGFVDVGDGCQVGTFSAQLFIRNGDLDIPVDASNFEVTIRPALKRK